MPEYNCPHCKYSTINKTQWNRHITSQRHQTVVDIVEAQKTQQQNKTLDLETDKDRQISLLKSRLDEKSKFIDLMKQENEELKQQLKDTQHQMDILTAQNDLYKIFWYKKVESKKTQTDIKETHQFI